MNWLRVIPPIIVLSLTWIIGYQIISNPIEPPKRPTPQNVLNVEGTTLKSEDFQVFVQTQGNVEPHTETLLIPRVAGHIINVSPSFRDGGFFKKGELLVEIDKGDYLTELISAQANLAQAKSALESEKARSQQAKENWEGLGLNEEPTALVLRKPQLAQAQADVDSAQARVEKATRDLEHTEIKAPYDGRIRGKGADVGQYVSPGSTIARIFAVDYVEIRLPIPPKEAAFIDLPEQIQNKAGITGPQPEVEFEITDARARQLWKGKIVRTEGVMDVRSRQVMAVAQIKNPYLPRDPSQAPLKIGQFVKASITGRTLKQHFVLPRSSVRDDNHIFTITEANTLERMMVEIIWANATSDQVVVQGEIKNGDILCITPIPFAVNGMKVAPTIDGVAPKTPKRPGGPPGGPGKSGGKKPGKQNGKGQSPKTN